MIGLLQCTLQNIEYKTAYDLPTTELMCSEKDRLVFTRMPRSRAEGQLFSLTPCTSYVKSSLLPKCIREHLFRLRVSSH